MAEFFNGVYLPQIAENTRGARQDWFERQLMDEQIAQQKRNEAMRASAEASNAQLYAGNAADARQTALAANNFQQVEAINQRQAADNQRRVESLATMSYEVSQLPKGQARQDYVLANIGRLDAAGVTGEQKEVILRNIDNDDWLRVGARSGISLKDRIASDEELASEQRKYAHDDAKPLLAQDGAVLVRNANGAYDTIYTPGTKPMQEIVTDPVTGEVRYVSVPGTPGTSYNPGSGSGGGDFSYGQQQQAVGGALTQRGLPAPVVAGLLGNFHVEGGYGGATGDGGSAAGIGQWRGERRQNFVKRYGVDPSKATMEQQADFVKWEFDNPQAAGMTVAQRNAILNARTPEEAAALIDQHYERSSGEHRGRRVAAAGQAGRALGGRSSGGGQQAPAQAQGTGPSVVSLGGGISGPRYTETRETVNGQEFAVQTDNRTGQRTRTPLGKAQAPVDYSAQISNADNALSTIDRALKSPGLDAAFGLPTLNPLNGNLAGYIVPGSPAADSLALIETIKSQAFLSQISQLKGMGALTDAEGARLVASIGNLDRRQSDKQVRENLGVIRGIIARGRAKAVSLRDRGGANNTNTAPSNSGGPTRVINGQTYVQRNGKWYQQ